MQIYEFFTITIKQYRVTHQYDSHRVHAWCTPVNTNHLYNIYTTLYKCYTNVLCLLGYSLPGGLLLVEPGDPLW